MGAENGSKGEKVKASRGFTGWVEDKGKQGEETSVGRLREERGKGSGLDGLKGTAAGLGLKSFDRDFFIVTSPSCLWPPSLQRSES